VIRARRIAGALAGAGALAIAVAGVVRFVRPVSTEAAASPAPAALVAAPLTPSAPSEPASEAWRTNGRAPAEVTASMLARAARGPRRDGGGCAVPEPPHVRNPEPRCAPAAASIDSVEIDWNASATNP
jgi:hypothetical protein